jgi:hypothetical protein
VTEHGELHDDRRTHDDRREQAGGGGSDRRGRRQSLSPLQYVLRSLGAVVLLVGIIIFAVRHTRPIYATRGTLAEELRKHAPAVAATLAPADTSQVARLMAEPEYQQQKRAFYEDVMRLNQVDSARADSIATYAVREAYVRGISPAIIFGVMLTENARFISAATSNVGAVGLMQVYPKVWLTKDLKETLGADLATDSTNVKYGVFILKEYFNPRTKSGNRREVPWSTALLRYNGCVKGTNTPRCHTYPSKVKNFVEKQATSICNGKGFYECIAKPFIAGLFGAAPDAGATAATAPPASGGDP